MNSESVYNLLFKRINGKFAKATVNKSISEALATVGLRCFDKDATEELYLINLLAFDSPEVDRWKGMVACWESTLKEQVPKRIYSTWKNYIKMKCYLMITTVWWALTLPTS